MENKKMYTYHFSLSDGNVKMYNCEGLFSDNGEKKILINTAAIVDVFYVDADGNRISNDHVESSAVESEVVMHDEVVEQ